MGKSNSIAELSQAESRGPTNQLQLYESLNKKGKALEGDSLDRNQENIALKKNGSSTEEMASTSEKDTMQTKAKAVKSRHTQSGPLMPGMLLSHSSSERARNPERFVSLHFKFLHLCLVP